LALAVGCVALASPLTLLPGKAGAGGRVSHTSARAAGTHSACLVPDVKGKTIVAARRAIKHRHCGVGKIGQAFSSTVAKGLVISQRPRPGVRRRVGSRVGLLMSKGTGLASAGRVVARISVPNAPLGLLALPSAVWVAAHHGDSIYRIDVVSNKVVAHAVVPTVGGEEPARMTFGNGTIFAANYSGTAVSLIDPVLDTVRSVIRAPLEDCCQPVFGAGSVWLVEFSSSTAPGPDRLVRLDPTGQARMTMNLRNGGGLTFGAGSVWGSSDGQVFRLDPTTNQVVAHIATDATPTAFGAGSVWGLSADNSKLIRVDPTTNSVSATIKLPTVGGALAATDSAVWVAQTSPDSNGFGSLLWKIDPATNRIVGEVKLGLGPVGDVLADLAVSDDGDVWVSAFDTNQVLRIHPTG
jgi:streptogramin lyase